jgi:GTP-sensing pleiotropic transcriptional regulator CodY
LVGIDEIKNQTIALKNMANGSQQHITIEALIELLKQHITNCNTNIFTNTNIIVSYYATHYITSQHIDFEIVKKIITENYTLALSDEAIQRIEKCRTYLDKKMASQTEPVYGINTGFGSLYNKQIDNHQLSSYKQI